MKDSESLPPDVRRIFLVVLCGLGDAICYVPSLVAIRNEYPDALIVALTNSAGRPIIEGTQLNIETIVYDRNQSGGLLNTLGTLWRIRKKRFDLVISRGLPNSYRIPLLAFLSGAKARVGGSSERLRFLYNYRIKLDDKVHIVEKYRQLLRGVGLETPHVGHYPRLEPVKKDRDSAMRIWEEAGISASKKVVGFAAGSDGAIRGKWDPNLKRWGAENYARVAQWLICEQNCQVVMFGVKNEEYITNEISALAAVNIINLCGKTSVGELEWLVRKCDLMICGDTGVMHLAVALGTPVVALYGPTDPLIWGPIGQMHQVLIGNAQCAPCYPIPTCESTECLAMKALNSQQVISTIDIILQRKRQLPRC